MSRLLTGSIDLSKIDKNKVITKDKNGQPFKNGAKYLNIALWINDKEDDYGNIASLQEQAPKGEKGTYIGNLKEFKKQVSTNEKEMPKTQSTSNDDLPW